MIRFRIGWAVLRIAFLIMGKENISALAEQMRVQ